MRALVLIILGLTMALGVQSYRLQGAKGELAVIAERDTAAKRYQASVAITNLKNKERTDEEYSAARKRAAVVLVQHNPAPAVEPTHAPAVGGDDSTVCFDRERLNDELAGWVERYVDGLNATLAEVARGGDGRFTAIARAGEGVSAAYRACRAFTLGQDGADRAQSPGR